MIPARAVLAICLALPGPASGFAALQGISSDALGPAESRRGFSALAGAIHIHSTYSNGEYDIRTLAGLAEEAGLDFIAVTDSFLTRVRYGLGPGRFLSLSRSRTSVLDRGLEDYLEDIRAARNAVPDLAVLAGVEIAPAYYWRGGVREGLDLFGFDHHLLVLGIEDPAVLRGLPVIENETWSNTERKPLRLAGPLLLFGFGALFLLSMRRVAGALIASAMVWAYLAYPFGELANPYTGRVDLRPYQRAVDYVAENGGLIFWSYPEARYPAIEMSGARMVSLPHPEDLWLTDNYDGFEGIYGDTITVTRPGGDWDRILMDYLAGRRQSWPSVITGIDFHYFSDRSGWYALDRGQTVLWAESAAEDSLLDALARGRGYSTFQGRADSDLRLWNYSLRSAGAEAIAGEALGGSNAPILSLAADWTGAVEEPLRIEIVRDGELVRSEIHEPPVVIEWPDQSQPGRHYYRVRISAGTTELLSNPIFFEVAGDP